MEKDKPQYGHVRRTEKLSLGVVGLAITMITSLVCAAGAQVSSDGLCYVSHNGNDSNNGLSWSTAKLTPYGCVIALPGGSSANNTAGTGTVFISQGTAGDMHVGGPNSGINILGGADPHWSNMISSASRVSSAVTLTFGSAHHYSVGQSITVFNVSGGRTSFNGNFTVVTVPDSTHLTYSQTGTSESATANTGQVIPFGWLREGGSLSFVGYGNTFGDNNPGGPRVIVQGGASTTATLALAGTGMAFRSENIDWRGDFPVRIGNDSNFGNHGGATGVLFTNSSFTVPSSSHAGAGPALKVGANVLWLFMNHVSFNALGQASNTISRISRTGNVVTVTLSAAAGTPYWLVGQQVIVSGVTDTSFNGTFRITSVTSGQTFSWVQTASNTTSSSGTLKLTADNDNRAAVLIDTTNGASGTGLLYIQDCVMNGGGGVRWKNAGGSGASTYVEHCEMEGQADSQPVYEAKAAPVPRAFISDIGISDSGNKPPSVRVAGSDPSATYVVMGPGQTNINVQGAATVVNSRFSPAAAASTAPNVAPSGANQYGQFGIRVYGEVDDVRRNFSPALSQFTNLATQSCASWTNITGANLTITCNVSDPTHHGTGAGNLNMTGTGNGTARIYSANRTVKTGDYIYIGGWIRASSMAGINPNFFGNDPLYLNFNSFPNNPVTTGIGHTDGAGNTSVTSAPIAQEDGNWQWNYSWDRMLNNSTNGNVSVRFDLMAAKGYPVSIYAPVFYYIPLSSISRASASISSVSRTDNVTTVTTSATHSFRVNQIVCLQDVTDATFNDCGQVLSVPSGTTLTLSNNGSNGTSSKGNIYAAADSEMGEIALAMAGQAGSCSPGQLCSAAGPIAGGAFSTKSSGYTLTASDSWTNVTGTTTITVPHAIVGSRWVVFNSGSNTVTIQADSGNINGGANIALSANTGKEITCDGTNCFAE